MTMTAKDFRRIALSLDGTEESSHMGSPDFRVGGHIFATLAHEKDGYGNLMLDAEHQSAFVSESPELFIPVNGGWGRMGATHVRLANAPEDILRGALHAAWKLRIQKNEAARSKSPRRLGRRSPGS
jgi:hypothetical protein